MKAVTHVFYKWTQHWKEQISAGSFRHCVISPVYKSTKANCISPPLSSSITVMAGSREISNICMPNLYNPASPQIISKNEFLQRLICVRLRYIKPLWQPVSQGTFGESHLSKLGSLYGSFQGDHHGDCGLEE